MKRTPKTASVVIAKVTKEKVVNYSYLNKEKTRINVTTADPLGNLTQHIVKWNGDILTRMGIVKYTPSDITNVKEFYDATEYVTEDEENEGE